MSTQSGLAEPSYDFSTIVRGLVRRDGAPRTARTLGISREAAMRLAAGLPIRRGTLALATLRLAAPANAESPSGIQPAELSTTTGDATPNGSSQ